MQNSKCDYSACERTHSVLSIVSEVIKASEVEELLHIKPTKISVKGEFFKTIEIKKHAYYLSTENIIISRNACDHLDWLVHNLSDKRHVIEVLQGKGCIVSVTCNWWSKYGGGGPVLGPIQMRGLAELNLPIGWNIWFKNSSYDQVG